MYRTQKSGEPKLSAFRAVARGLEVQLQLELCSAWAALIERTRIAYGASLIESRLVAGAIEISLLTGVCGIQQNSGCTAHNARDEAEVAHVEEIVESNPRNEAQTLMNAAEANRVVRT